MGASMQVTGLDELMRKLDQIGDRAEEVAARSLYRGAGVMADAFTQAANSIRTEEFRYVFNGRKRDPSPEEKAALQGKTGIAKFNINGSEVNTAIGLNGSGYVTIAGKQKAVKKIANAINSGTSFMNKQPVFRRAASQTSGAARGAIVQAAEELLNEIIK